MEQNFPEIYSNKSATDPGYFFPSVEESEPSPSRVLSGPDDWTVVTDRCAKKKIQNRVAQRTYRSRVKQRLEYMQQQVDILEKEAQLSNRRNHGRDSSDSTAPTSMNNARSPVENDQTSTTSGPNISKSTSTADQPSLRGQLSGQTYNDQQERASREGTTNQQSSMDWSLPYLPRYLWPPGQQQPIAPVPNVVPFAPDHVNPAYPNASLSPRTMEERLLQYQSMPINGFPLPHMYFAYQDLFNQKGVSPNMACEVQSDLDPKHMRVTGPQDAPGFPFTPLSMNRSLQTTEGLESSTPSPSLKLANKPSVTPAGRNQTRLETPDSSMAASPRTEDTHARPSKDAALHDRFRYVLDCAKNVGFDSFDALVSRYYTADFEDSSGLSNEQRLSRMRRLPGFLAAVHDSSTGWTQWEKQGYQDEILKSAESILSAECSKFSQSGALEDELVRIDRSDQDQRSYTTLRNHDDERSLPGLNATIRNILQDKLPNLWALVTALTMDNTALRQRDRSHIVFTTLLVMCCSGRSSMSQIGSWVSNYFDSQHSKGS